MKKLLLLCCLLPFLTAAQSPWARSKAGFYAQAAYHFIPTYTRLYSAGGADRELERAVSERSVQLYGEYGLTRRTTLIASVPMVFNRRGDSNPASPYLFFREDSGSVSGPGNTTLGIRHQFLSGKLALSGALRVDLPAGGYQANTGLRRGYPALTVLPAVSAGMGLGKIYWFAYGGYGLRSNDYSHFIKLGAEGGYRLGEQLWLIGFSEYTGPLRNGALQLPSQDVLTGLYVNDQGWWSVGAKGIWQINRFVGAVASYTAAAWAQNVPQSPAIGLGLYFKWE